MMRGMEGMQRAPPRCLGDFSNPEMAQADNAACRYVRLEIQGRRSFFAEGTPEDVGLQPQWQTASLSASFKGLVHYAQAFAKILGLALLL